MISRIKPALALLVAEDKFVPKPANLTFEQVADVPGSASTTLWGLRDAGKVRPG